MQKRLVVVGGPTAVGKTALGIELAKSLNTEIISADSRQFYQELAIGTAKPSPEELAEVKHHFVDNLSIHDAYSAGDFEREVLRFLEEYFIDNDVMVMVGGSGLFVRAVSEGLDEFPDVPEDLRESLNHRLYSEGIEPLQKELKKLDKETYETMDIHNSQRLVRALEVCLSEGKPYSYYKNKSKLKRNFETINIGLNTDREVLYDRINQRVDIMMNRGLLKEAKTNYEFRDLAALKTVGYQELFDHIDGKTSLEEAKEFIKRNTRRFAKRQITWFKKEKGIKWFEPNELKEILNYLKDEFNVD
ncbi:tRNA (adenosine(37)-N6)-dimethylallyltransferase MiaA [Cyclobacteriaceae bacterium]|nr:tRNA (adenosine(37)-N6)-dimethylallyltransferase MiaA [Cyclobacteriaceae bacterium]